MRLFQVLRVGITSEQRVPGEIAVQRLCAPWATWGHIQALTTAHSGLRVVLEDGLGEVRPCRTSQQQGRRNVLTPGGELGRAMPWYRSGVLCNSQTSRRPVGDDGDVPHHPQVLEGVGGDTIVGIGGQGGGIRI